MVKTGGRTDTLGYAWPMIPDDFRQAALAQPGAIEASHMGHPDFRVNQKIFASLGYPDAQWATILLTPLEQRGFALAHPATFSPVKGYWGEKGATQVKLAAADPGAVEEALAAAWRSKSLTTARKPQSPKQSASRGTARSR